MTDRGQMGELVLELVLSPGLPCLELPEQSALGGYSGLPLSLRRNSLPLTRSMSHTSQRYRFKQTLILKDIPHNLLASALYFVPVQGFEQP